MEAELRFEKVDAASADAQLLVEELNEVLIGIIGNNGAMYVHLDDFRTGKGFFLIGYEGKIPVCCAGVREMDDATGEVKRVYARANGKGNGAALMHAVEEAARELGYQKLVLECRTGNGHAIDFYLANGYVTCENYAPYIGVDDAVCLEQMLQQNDSLGSE